MTMTERKEKVAALVKRFKQDEQSFKSNNFNEASTRNQFLNAFLECLGWDVENSGGARHGFETVKVEDDVLMDGGVKHTDYTLCVGGMRQLIIEAKKPSVNIKNDPSPAIQSRRYSRTLKLPVTIVTNFSEFAIYDANIKVNPQKDTASTARIEYITCDKYVEKFDELYSHFSYDAVSKGEFAAWCGDSANRKGTETIDEEFLKMIERWRELLAEDISLHNNVIDEETLTSDTQRIIDRIVFLRIAEGKGIEVFGDLRNACITQSSDNNFIVYENLNKLFEKANNKFNAGLFKKEGNTENLVIQNSSLKEIINELYEPLCHYDFAALPVEILGSVYERFLGKVVRFSRKTKNGHSVVVEEKPEVQKAGGVYYTPNYIVQYIVQKTIGKAIEGKTPDEVEKMHFLDPACGSGSFLVGSYDFLLNWHLSYYTKDNAKIKNALKNNKIYEVSSSYKLSVAEKKRILKNNIYGVDIDKQAVEVTKLSLFLKILEDESALTNELFRASEISQEKILPNMESNIKCGNSLIGSDYWNNKPQELFDDKSYFRSINSFDWDKAFPEIFSGSESGFDCIIGNPPYVSAPNMIALGMSDQRTAIASSPRYTTLYQKWDLYVPFVELGISMLKENGIYGSIIPLSFTNQTYAKLLREKIINEYNLISIADLSGVKVFAHATVTNCIPIIQKAKPNKKCEVVKPQTSNSQELTAVYEKSYSDIMSDKKTSLWNLSNQSKLISKHSNLHTLGDYCYISKGMVLNSDENAKTGKFVKADLISETKDNVHCKEYIEPKNMSRYKVKKVRYLEYGTKRCPDKLSRPTFPELYQHPKLMFNRLGNLQVYCDTEAKFMHSDSMFSGVLWKDLKGVENKSISASIKRYSKLPREKMEMLSENVNLLFLLAVMNSKYVSKLLNDQKGSSLCIYPEHLRAIPIPNASQKEQEHLAELARHLMQIYEKKTLDETEKKQADILENQVNQLVETLYNK